MGAGDYPWGQQKVKILIAYLPSGCDRYTDFRTMKCSRISPLFLGSQYLK